MHGAAEAERLYQLSLLEFASSKCVWEIYIEDEKERKQEIAKNPKDDDEKRKKGEIEKGYQRKQAFRMASRSKGEIGIWTLECCALTDNRDNSLTTRTITSTWALNVTVTHKSGRVRSIPKAYTLSPNHNDSVYDSIYSLPRCDTQVSAKDVNSQRHSHSLL